MSDRLANIERHEYKYLVHSSLVPEIRSVLQSVCHLDEFAGDDGSYPIRSLYFDSWDKELFWANEREAGDRFKVRVRSYPGTQAPVFLEIKRRVLDVIHKTRVAVPRDQWVALIEEPSNINKMHWKPRNRPLAERFLSLLLGYNLRPVIMVDYDREAYASPIDYYARATLDFHIACQPCERLTHEVDPKLWRYVDHPVRTWTQEPVWVLELKFGRTAPAWMSAMVRRLDLVRYEFSKYAYSLWDSGILPRERIPTGGVAGWM